MPVFFIHSEDVVDGVVTITAPLLTHISKSLRAKSGDSLLFNDDQGHRYHTTILQITKQSLQAKIQHVEDPPLSTRPSIILAQAILKGEKMGWVIQKATELGVSAIAPLITDRVILNLSETQRETHQARWMRIALEAAQQSERWTLPTILPLQTFQQFLESHQERLHILMAERAKGISLLHVPCSMEKPGSGVTVIIGPEGGWSAEEIEAAQSHNWTFASFGKEILRAETASLAALAILQARFNAS
ncbi:MAG: 16S rRNA (uracil(1498)-N(3))-methyltransferase [Nitrospirota bacterium]|nr:MAG: 16S rRNA (uracil(1498)-N(3))-methyltransferase [Nitrospirota bacterium]